MSAEHRMIHTLDFGMVYAVEHFPGDIRDLASPTGVLWHSPGASPELALLSVSQLMTRLAGVCGISIRIEDFGTDVSGLLLPRQTRRGDTEQE